ncbi:MAG: MBL fold hydrolase [Candidatus Nephrothrix sp. EaCA]|nr:MAG: MBL fold hydrolase [Candidatus Nephrothrix sp. EaCA]
MTVYCFTFGPLLENTYVIHDDKEAMIIDPGCCNAEEEKKLGAYIFRKDLQVKLLLNTHCHVDHVMGNYFVKQRYNVPFRIHAQEESALLAAKAYAFNYGFDHYQQISPDSFLEEGEVITVGKSQWEVLFVPGHSPGHVAFYNEKERVLVSGDVLFQRSIGRADLPGGDFDTLIDSIHQKLFTLPDDVKVYTGHGGTTDIGTEKKTNLYCALK